MSKVNDYTLVTGDTQDDLIKQIKMHLAEGWQPIGGVSVIFIEKNFMNLPEGEENTLWSPTCEFTQAMVKMF